MRKVTASAVILTAITGCSQSEVPSSKWSFDTPTNQQPNTELFGQQSADQTKGNGLQSNAFAFASPNDAPAATVADPAGSLSDAATLATVPDLPGQEVPLGISTRTDPLASVRSYLNATSNVGDISNRVPYSSQVYLPEAPTYSPSAVSADSAVPLAPLEGTFFTPGVDASLAVADFAQGASESFPTQGQVIAATPTTLDPLVANTPLDASPAVSINVAPQSFISADAVSLGALSSAALSPEEARYVSDSYIEESSIEANSIEEQPTRAVAFQDTLPILEPAPLDLEPALLEPTLFEIEPAPLALTQSTFEDASQSRSISEPTVSELASSASEPVSVGTALLQTLAQNGDSEALATLAAAEVESGTVEIFVDEAPTAPEAVSAERQPTLAGLLASMPGRGDTPLVRRFEDSQRTSQSISRMPDGPTWTAPVNDAIPVFRPLPLEMPLPAGLLNSAPAEASVGLESVDLAPGEISPVEPGLLELELLKSSQSELELSELDLSELELFESSQREAVALAEIAEVAHHSTPNGHSSPLLESLAIAAQSSVALSAVYVPIPESSDIDISAALIREAIAALSHEIDNVQPIAPAALSMAQTSEPSAFAIEVLATQGQDDMSATLLRFSEASHSTSSIAESAAAHKHANKKRLPIAGSRYQPMRHRQRIVWQ